MYLKALEMQGFKSFPDKTVLEFDRGMTAVVGPNGSGKSNISDSVMWVLGEQSVKTLRSSKMEDVIFSGTEKRRPMGYAEVTLRLDNKDRSFEYDADEIAVTRRYYRSGESEYKINGKTARLKDIHELFMDTGLGRDGYSMVGQGRIESIVSAKSADRREIFEEAVGISHYRYRRTDALKRLDQAEENLVRLRDIAGELEGRLEPLKKQSEKAVKFLDLSEQKKQLEIGLWVNTIDKSKETIRRQSEKLDITQNDYRKAVEELENIYNESQSHSESVKNITVEIERARRLSAEFEQQARDILAECELSENKILNNRSVIERINNDMKAENSTDESLNRQIAENVGLFEKTEQKAKEISLQINLLEEKVNSLFREESRLKGLLLENGSKVSILTQELSENKIESTSAESAVAEIENRLSQIASEFEQKTAEAKKYRSEYEKYNLIVKDLKEKLAGDENSLSGYSMLVGKREEKLLKAKKEAEIKSAELSAVVSRKNMLIETERNMEGYQGSVRAVIRESEKGNLSGIRGPVSRIISVDGSYAVAVETALGASVQNIVTENENDAKRAMYFLKNTNSGRATFLPMSAVKARYLDEKGLADCIGFIAVASDIVSFDKEYSGIVGNLLGRTVLADNVDNAVKIAKKYSHRFKIVTLDGQVINAGGSMTGGSGIRNSGFMTRSGEIEKLSEKCEALKQQYDALQRDITAFSSDFEKAKADYEGIKADIFNTKEAVVKNESLAGLMLGNAENAEKAVLAFEEERNKANIRLEEFGNGRGKTETRIEELEKLIKGLSEQSDKLQEQAETAVCEKEKTVSEISGLNILLAEKKTENSARQELIQSLESRKSGHKDRIALLSNEQKQLEDEIEDLKIQISEKKRKAEVIRNNSTEQEELINRKVNEREQYEINISELRMAEREKNSLKENLASEIVRLEEKKNTLVKERDDLEKKLFDEYNLTSREAHAMNIELESITGASSALADIKRKIKSLGSVYVGAVEEYKEVSERYEFLSVQLKDIESSKEELLRLVADLTEKMSEQFKTRFDSINQKFGETFSELFGGGKGELILEDESNILECGIEIKAQPPGKNVKSISLLSGGEKGLCAIALLFAILKVNPAPFCIFDEVEAALDDVNVSRFAGYVRQMTDNTQFILITHRRGSMEEADVMYGVTMQEHGVSKLLELRTAEMAAQIGIE